MNTFMRSFWLSGLFAVGLTLSPVAAEAQSKAPKSLPVKSSWGSGTFGVSGMPGRWTYRYTVINSGGTLHVCGAGYTTGRMREFAWQMQRRAEIKVNGKKVLRNIQFFTKAKRPQNGSLVGVQAKCKSTGAKAPSGRPRASLELTPGFVR